MSEATETGAGPLRVAVLTRTGRPSGMRLAAAVHATRHELCGVVAEKRSTMIRRMFRKRSPWSFLRTYVPGVIVPRLFDRGGGETPAGEWPAAVPDALVHVVDSLNGEGTMALLRDWALDLLVVANAPILADAVMACARLGGVNFHTGRLPEYGGVATEFWSLYEGQAALVATLHRVTRRLDSGDILAEWPVDIGATDTPATLHARAITAAAAGIGPVLDRLAAGDGAPVRVPGPATCRRWPTFGEWRTLRRRQAQVTKR